MALLARTPLFSSLSPPALERLAAATLTLRPRSGEVLFDQGEPARGIIWWSMATSADLDHLRHEAVA
jgi:CRP-like cAMP-binding protein